MWWPSGQDPGGSEGESPSKEPAHNQQLSDLQEQFEQQQTFIAQLKEMLRKTEQSSSVSREKVEEYASTLNEINARAKKSKMRKTDGKKSDTDDSSASTSISKKTTVVTPAKEKINLLRQQLEENRVKIAQRDKNQKGIEEMVNQLKTKLDESQLMINLSQCNMPKIDVKPMFTIESSKEELLSIIKLKDASIEELTAKIQLLHANVLDLQENVKEKDSVIEARTKAITLLSENLSKKSKNTLDMLDATKEEMRVMQQNFVAMETKMKEANARLKTENYEKEKTIEELQSINSQLEEKCSYMQEMEERFNSVSFELQMNNEELTENEIKIKKLNKINEDLKIRLSEMEETSSKSSAEKSEQASQKSSKYSKSGKRSKSKEGSPDADSKIAELEKMVDELKKAKEDLENESTKQSTGDILEIDEIVKLNKQLEEMNKNMIKMKAQHKAKLKELQRKVLPPSEMGEKLLNLESENLKIGQRVAELEEEKGNLQLRLVDYESNKEKEYIADLENKIEEQKMEIENHIRTITNLESQITTSLTEISSLRTELANLMHIENAQVCSEISSVQLEEQLDKEVSQKKEIQNKFNELVVEKEELIEKINELTKEKQELNVKLDNYMQENMELIDRLEKLSAEKVSSAESIEIVESLTQQEKLEIEAYQKEFKPNEDQEETSELNDSVSKLTEETSELMERIELFTVERREVMEKMDSLNSENQQLMSKIEKLEIDKINLELHCDHLNSEKEDLSSKLDKLTAEYKLNKTQSTSSEATPEELRKNIIEYEALIENQKQQIKTLQKELTLKSTEKNRSLNKQLQLLKLDHEHLLQSYQEISYNFKQSSEVVYEKDEMESDLKYTRELVSELRLKVTESGEEIQRLHLIIEENKNDFITSTSSIIQLQTELSFKATEIESLKYEAENLQDLVTQLNLQIEHKDVLINSKEDTINMLSPQLSELKSIISENCDQLQHYETEMNQNTATIENLTEQLNDLNYKIVETEHIIELKNDEINQLKSEKQTAEARINKLDNDLKQKNDNFSETVRQLKERCKFLENQIRDHTGFLEDLKEPFHTKIQELEKKNAEQMEKMKKIAANLKKKVITCQELETRITAITDRSFYESKGTDEKQKVINEYKKQLKIEEEKNELLSYHLNVELSNFELQKTQYKDEIIYLTLENSKTAAKLQQYEEYLSDKQIEIKQLQVESKNITVEMLQEEIESLKICYTALGAKLQEKDAFIESLEAENCKTKEHVNKLEEGLSSIEERRQLLEEQAIDLSVQLEAKDSACKEATETEDLLEQRLSALMSHDKMVEKRLKQTITENQNLNKKVKAILRENNNLLTKQNEFSLKLANNEQLSEKVDHLENENIRLNEVATNLETELRKNQHDFDRKLSDKNAEIESMETELTSQLEVLNAERKNVLGYCETLKDNLRDYSDVEQGLNDEIDQFKRKLSDSKSEFDKILRDNQDLTIINSNQLKKMQDLENQLTDLRSTTETVDAHKLMEDIHRLENAIAQKDLDIQNYQRQNMQLQMNSLKTTPTSKSVDSASLFGSPEPQIETQTLKNQLAETQNQRSQLEQQVAEMTKTINSFKVELENSDEKRRQLKSTNSFLKRELAVHVNFEQRLEEEMKNQQQLMVRQSAESGVNEIILAAEKNVADVSTSTDKDLYIENIEAKLAQVTQELESLKSSENLTEDILKLSTQIKHSSLLIENKTDCSEEELIQKEVSQILSATPITKPPEDITKEELLRKIKALEFMLYNVEQEKDDTLVQCHQFTNELTRLVYERERLIKEKPIIEEREIDLRAIEGEILVDSPNNPETKKELHNLEYSPAHASKQQSKQPVVEEVIEPKIAYICFTDNNEPKPSTSSSSTTKNRGVEDQKLRDSIESQIIDTVDISTEEKRAFQQLEFQTTQLPIVDTKPVVEPTAETQTAYLCYPEDTFASEEDGWGWNAEEAKLEAEHRQTVQAFTTSPPAQIKIEQLEERINDLEVERSRLLDEIKTCQVRSGKLIKKLKELKQKNDGLTFELNKQFKGDFDVLDMAIQDELNTQIKTMEKKLKELTEEMVKEKSNKENLLKRIDVLTAANERLIELKEKQDSDVQFWQFKNRELTSKLEQFEWGDDSAAKVVVPAQTPSIVVDQLDSKGVKNENSDLNNKIQELNSIVNDLTLDNEEMQSLLEEQRQMRLDAEKALLNVPKQENMKPVQEFIELEDKFIYLQGKIQKYEELLDKNVRPRENTQLDSIRSAYDEKIFNLESEITSLKSSIETVNDEKKLLEDNSILLKSSLELKTDELQQKLAKSLEENSCLKNQFSTNLEQLQIEKQDLNQQISNLKSENETIIAQQTETAQLTTNLELEKQNLTQEISNLKSVNETTNKQLAEITQFTTNLELEKQNLTQQISILKSESETTIKQLTDTTQITTKLEAEKQKLTEHISKLKTENETIAKQLTDTTQLMKEVELEKQNLAQQNLSITSKHEAIIKQQIESTQFEIIQLTSKITTLEGEKQQLEATLAEKDVAVQQLNTQIQQLESEKSMLELKIQEILNIQNSNDTNDEKLQQMNDKLMETLTELDSKQKELSLLQLTLNNERLGFETKLSTTIQQLNEEWSVQVDQRGSDVADSWKIHLNSRETEFSQKEQEFTTNLSTLKSKNEELVLENSELQKNVSILQTEKLALISADTTKILQQNLNEKELEIAQLTQKLHVELEQKTQEKELAIAELTKNAQQISLELHQKIDEKELEIAASTNKLQNLKTELQQQNDDKNVQIAQLTQQVKHLNSELETEIHEKTVEMAELTQKLWELSFELEKKSNETQTLREDQALEIETLKLQFSEKEEKLEALLQIQDSDLQNLRVQLTEYTRKLTKEENDIMNLQIQLDSKIVYCTEIEAKLNELTQQSEEKSSQLTELRQLIETQVLKIEELKTQLYEKSNDYDAIISEFDTLQLQKQKKVTFKDLPPEEPQEHIEEDLSEPISRAELDLALYMLHQRDVRCEELTVELMQLLEERDTLQLRLSNAIRINEQLRAKPHENPNDSQLKESPKAVKSTGAIPRSKTSSIVLGATGTELATEATEQEIMDEARTQHDRNEIATKMSLLRSIGYRDKTLRDDQESRHMQQMSVMQQHRDLAAKLPAEAAARLVDASYTLSRDVQSPSKVLLNWLWGRSTPKVNDI